jgi:hypothetical protein
VIGATGANDDTENGEPKMKYRISVYVNGCLDDYSSEGYPEVSDAIDEVEVIAEYYNGKPTVLVWEQEMNNNPRVTYPVRGTIYQEVNGKPGAPLVRVEVTEYEPLAQRLHAEGEIQKQIVSELENLDDDHEQYTALQDYAQSRDLYMWFGYAASSADVLREYREYKDDIREAVSELVSYTDPNEGYTAIADMFRWTGYGKPVQEPMSHEEFASVALLLAVQYHAGELFRQVEQA